MSTTTTIIENLQQENSILKAKVEEYQRYVDKLHQQIVQNNKRQFGRKTERLSVDDRQALLFELPPAPAVPQKEELVEITSHKRLKRGRKPIPSNIPRERIEYAPESTNCSSCSDKLVKIGEEITEELEYVPAQLKVIEHVRVKLACRACKNKVHTAKLPGHVQPLERSRPGVGLLTHLIISKYCDHLPLHRQEQMFARLGVIIPRQRMCDWIGDVVSLLEPVYYAIRDEILKQSYVQADETSMKVQDRSEKENIVTGYFWGVHAPPNLVWFKYAQTRASEVPLDIFKNFQGALQTDAYAGYNKVLIPDKVSRIACMAHIRRRFIESRNIAQKECNYIIKLIAELYKIEEAIKKLKPEEILAKRKADSIPVLDKLFEYMQQLQLSMLPKHLLQEHLSYALEQKTEVYRYTQSSVYQIDNNPIERQIRPIAIGRKNYLFAGSHEGAHRAAVLYSIINSAKLCNINPYNYLRDIITRVFDRNSTLKQLLPHNWSKLSSSADLDEKTLAK